MSTPRRASHALAVYLLMVAPSLVDARVMHFFFFLKTDQAAHGTQHATPRHRPLQTVRALEESCTCCLQTKAVQV